MRVERDLRLSYVGAPLYDVRVAPRYIDIGTVGAGSAERVVGSVVADWFARARRPEGTGAARLRAVPGGARAEVVVLTRGAVRIDRLRRALLAALATRGAPAFFESPLQTPEGWVASAYADLQREAPASPQRILTGPERQVVLEAALTEAAERLPGSPGGLAGLGPFLGRSLAELRGAGALSTGALAERLVMLGEGPR